MTKSGSTPVARAQMTVRRPVARVFEAVVDPAIASRYWFSKGSARLEPGKRVRWDWEMYGVSTNVDVKEIEENCRILMEWNGPDNPSSVEWIFEARSGEETLHYRAQLGIPRQRCTAGEHEAEPLSGIERLLDDF